MPRVMSAVVLLALVTACSKKSDTPEQAAPPQDPAVTAKASRDKAISRLKASRSEEAAWELAVLSDVDKDVVPALVEALKDKANAGLGRRLPDQYSSVREGVVNALIWCEDPGIAALKDKGFVILREGLADPIPAVREHTILAIAVLKDHASPLAGDIFKLCTDPNEKVRGVAFDTLQKIGVPDSLGMVLLLSHKESDVRRLAAEAVLNLEQVPDAALEPLLKAFQAEDATVRAAAIRAVSTLGPKAEKAVPLAVKAIRKTYADPDPDMLEGEDYPYWAILLRVGPKAVPALQELLKDRSIQVQRAAAQTLALIGPPAKDAAADLKAALMGMDARLVFNAAVALCRIGTGEDEAVAAVTRGLNNEDDLVVSNAIDTIPFMGKAGASLIPIGLAKAESEMPFTRRSALELAVQLGPEGAVAAAALGKGAADDENELLLRERYIKALGAMGPAARPALASLYTLARGKDEKIELRRAALNASVAIAGESPETTEVLKQAAADSSAELQTGAAQAMGQLKPMPPEVATTLAGMMTKSRSMAVRRTAAKSLALASPPPANAKAELETVAKGRDDLAFWARFALASIDAKPDGIETLVRDGLKDRRVPAIRAAAIACLPRLGTANAKDLPTLTEMLGDGSPEVRAAAAVEVARHGAAAKNAVRPLIPLLFDRNSEVQFAAIAALAAIGPDAAPAIPRLKRLLRTGDESTVFAVQLAIPRIQPAEEARTPRKP